MLARYQQTDLNRLAIMSPPILDSKLTTPNNSRIKHISDDESTDSVSHAQKPTGKPVLPFFVMESKRSLCLLFSCCSTLTLVMWGVAARGRKAPMPCKSTDAIIVKLYSSIWSTQISLAIWWNTRVILHSLLSDCIGTENFKWKVFLNRGQDNVICAKRKICSCSVIWWVVIL